MTSIVTEKIYFDVESTMAASQELQILGPPDPIYRYVIAAMLIVFAFVGTVCNSLSLAVISRESNVKTSTVLISSLAVTDLFTSAFILPASVYMILANYVTKYEIICHVYYVFTVTSVPYSAIIVTGIAIDRLCYAIWPYCHVMQVAAVKAFVSIAAAATLAFAVLSALCYSVYRPLVVRDPDDSMEDWANSKNFYDEVQFNSSHYQPRPADEQAEIDAAADADSQPFSQTFVYTGQCSPQSVYLSEQQMLLLAMLNTLIFITCMAVTCVAYFIVFCWAIRRRLQQQSVQDRRNRYLAKHSIVPPIAQNTFDQEDGTAAEPLTQRTSSPPNQRNSSEPPTTRSSGAAANSTPRPTHMAPTSAAIAAQKAAVQSRNLKLYFKTLLTVVLVTVVFVATTTPALLVKYQVFADIDFNMQNFIFYLHYINSWANPFIYYAVNETFRSNLATILRRRTQQLSNVFGGGAFYHNQSRPKFYQNNKTNNNNNNNNITATRTVNLMGVDDRSSTANNNNHHQIAMGRPPPSNLDLALPPTIEENGGCTAASTPEPAPPPPPPPASVRLTIALMRSKSASKNKRKADPDEETPSTSTHVVRNSSDEETIFF